MIDLNTLRKAKGYVLAIVDESTGEYKPVSSDVVQVIRCKDCALWNDADSEHLVGYCTEGDDEKITFRNEWCCWAERKDEYVILHPEDIHFIDEDAERAFYEALTERVTKNETD